MSRDITDAEIAAGLSIRVRLLRSLPTRYKVDIRVKPGSHQSEHAREYPQYLLHIQILT